MAVLDHEVRCVILAVVMTVEGNIVFERWRAAAETRLER